MRDKVLRFAMMLLMCGLLTVAVRAQEKPKESGGEVTASELRIRSSSNSGASELKAENIYEVRFLVTFGYGLQDNDAMVFNFNQRLPSGDHRVWSHLRGMDGVESIEPSIYSVKIRKGLMFDNDIFRMVVLETIRAQWWPNAKLAQWEQSKVLECPNPGVPPGDVLDEISPLPKKSAPKSKAKPKVQKRVIAPRNRYGIRRMS